MSKKEEQARDAFKVKTPFNKQVKKSESKPKEKAPKETTPKETNTAVDADATKTQTQNEQESKQSKNDGPSPSGPGPGTANVDAGTTGDGGASKPSNVSGSKSGEKSSGEGKAGEIGRAHV